MQIALTFEAGGDEKVAAQMLDILRDGGARTTIFLHGAWARDFPALVKRMVVEGHELGNHTYTHPDLTLLADEQIRIELQRVSELALQLTGQPARPWLRPPFAALDRRVRQVVAAEGYKIIQRNAVDGGHWPGRTTRATITSRTLQNARDGAVIAYHLSSVRTARAMPTILQQLREAGYTLVTLSDLPDPSEMPERHPHFAGLQLEPGYLQVKQPGATAWSMNLLEFGARESREPGTLVQLTGDSSIRMQLQVGEGDEGWKSATDVDRFLLALAGTVQCRFRREGAHDVALRAIARPHDIILWPAACQLRLSAGNDDQRRWIVLILAGMKRTEN